MRKTAAAKSKKGARPVWKGTLRFGLVSIPVRAFTAKAAKGGDVDLDWLHESCHSRIKLQKVCPIHGPVTEDEIVSGYKYGKKGYVVIEPQDLAALQAQNEDEIKVEAAIPPESISQLYHTDKSYFLLPDGEAAARPYLVFREALVQQDRHAVAQVVLFRRTHVILLWPLEEMLVMTILAFPDHFKKVSLFADQVPRVKYASQELDLAKTLLDNLADEDFDFTRFHDPRKEQLTAIIEAKVKGEEIEAPPPEEDEPVSLDFMDALRKSVTKAVEASSVKKTQH